MRRLIVNADDLGLCATVDAGILAAHDDGILTSASLMVGRPTAAEAAAAALERPRMGIGLHLELDDVPAERLADECAAQLERFRDLTGVEPTHLDTHHHLHFREPVRSVVLALGDALDLPVRGLRGGVRFEGGFWGRGEDGGSRPDAISASALRALVASLPDGVTELCCHPARGGAPGSSYDAERALELEALCDPSVRQVLDAEGIHLVSFRELA